MAAKIDATADYICKAKWGDVEFPPPFGREAYPEVRAEGQLIILFLILFWVMMHHFLTFMEIQSIQVQIECCGGICCRLRR